MVRSRAVDQVSSSAYRVIQKDTENMCSCTRRISLWTILAAPTRRSLLLVSSFGLVTMVVIDTYRYLYLGVSWRALLEFVPMLSPLVALFFPKRA